MATVWLITVLYHSGAINNVNIPYHVECSYPLVRVCGRKHATSNVQNRLPRNTAYTAHATS